MDGIELPLWILPDAASQADAPPLLCVDGVFGDHPLHLSHWPGNRTPADLRHDLSTGSSLAFVKLAPEERARRLAGLAAAANNHFDTDGTCALWALYHPAEALAREEALLHVAAAGDFFHVPTDRAFCIDQVVAWSCDARRSPLAHELREAADRARYERATAFLFEHLAGLLDGELEPFRDAWEEPLETLQADRADLASAAREDLVHLEWTWWTAPRGAASARGGADARRGDAFDPGRHALFSGTPHDRILVEGPSEAGTTYRFLLGTRSWFDLSSPAPLPRPDLAALSARLNELEGTDPASASAWRSQADAGASPELWFGAADNPAFSEHAGASLHPSRLAPEKLRAEIADALRAALVLPD